MFRPRWRKVLADLWENKARTLLVVASIAVGVFAIGVIAGTYVLVPQDLNTSYSAINPANIRLTIDPFDRDFVEAVRRMDGVAAAEGRRDVTVRVQIGPHEWNKLTLTAIPDYPDSQIDCLLPREGAPAPGDYEAILEINTLASLDLAVGDFVDVELSDGTRRRMRIAGAAQQQTDPYGIILGDLYGYVTYNTLEWLHEPPYLNKLSVVASGDRNDPARIREMTVALRKRVEDSGRQVYVTDTSPSDTHPLASIIQALLGVLGILGVLVVFLSGSLIANTMSALLAQHLRQIGVMKLVGARRLQVVGMYVALIEAFGLIALVAAVPLGTWGAYGLTRFVASIVNFVVQGYRLVPLAVALQVLIALGVPLVAGLWPVLRGSQVSVQRAIGGDGASTRSTMTGGFRAALGGWLKGITVSVGHLSRPFIVSMRNTFRRKGRLMLTLFTLTLGGAIFIAVLNAQVALERKVERLGEYFLADVNLDFAIPYRIEQIKREALAMPGVESVEVWTSTSAEFQIDGVPARNITILALPADSRLVSPVLLQGRWLLPDDAKAITVNDAFWGDYPDLGVGDTLRLKIAGDEDDWTIVGIFQYTGMDDLFAYANYNQVAQLLGASRHASMYRVVTTDHSLAFQQRVSEQLDSHFRTLGYRVSKVEAGNSFAASVTGILGILTAVLVIMALLTALVGSIGLAGTMSMNVLERTREIGVLRAIGAHNGIVFKLVLSEGVLIGLISYVLGAALSFPITNLLSNVISESIFNSPADPAFTVQGFVSWLAVVLVLSVLASIIPARNATRLTIREVLAYE